MDETYRTEVEQIEARLRSCLGNRVRHFRLVLQNGGLVLQGCACSYYVKQLAQHTVATMTGLPVLGNEIEVG
jgi:osmotically-inducible protein OsmY